VKKFIYILGVCLLYLLIFIPNIPASDANIGKPKDLNLPVIEIQDIKYFYVSGSAYGVFMSNNRFFFWGSESGENLINLSDWKTTHVISPYNISDFTTGEKKISRILYNPHIIIEDLGDEMVYYDIDRPNLLVTKWAKGPMVITGKTITAKDDCLKEFQDNFDERPLSFDAGSTVKQGRNELIMFNNKNSLITRYDMLDNTCTVLSEKESGKMVNEFMHHDLAGETGGNTRSFLRGKQVGYKNGYPGIQGVYEPDEKGNEKQIFKYGRMIWFCPDEKTRIVTMDIPDTDNEYMVVLFGHGEKAAKIYYRISRESEIAALSLDRKKLAVFDEDKDELIIITFKEPLY